MKSWKFFWVCVLAGTLGSGFLTACGKKGDDSSLTYGSLYSDGQSVSTSSSTVQGMPLRLQISGITVLSTGYGTTGVCYTGYCPAGYGTSGYGGQLRFDLTINGMPTSISTTSSWVGWQQMSGWYVASTGACTTPTCSIAVVSVVVTPMLGVGVQNYEFRQIAVKKDMTNNRILAMREFSLANTNMLHSATQLANEF